MELEFLRLKLQKTKTRNKKIWVSSSFATEKKKKIHKFLQTAKETTKTEKRSKRSKQKPRTPKEIKKSTKK